MRHELTGILTTKVEDNKPATAQRYGFMPFMADCAVLLSQRVADRVAVRAMRVLKYRGSPHVLNEVPFVIGPAGVEVGSSNGVHPEPQPFKERVSTGIERLDAMLGGGFYRGTNALITGSSGSGKSTLAGAFIEAACRRGERALFISFDENSRDIVRDLATMSIDLAPHLASGLLRMEAVRSEAASSEEHFMRIKRLIAEQQPRCVAIDPLSALARVGGGLAARAVAERLIYLCRNAGITVLFTSLLEGIDPHLETTTLHVSTICGFLDSDFVCAARRRAQPRALDHQIARLEALQSTARADLQRQRHHARRSLHRRRRGAHGHLAHGKGERRVNEPAHESHHANGAYVFRLYLAGGAPNSVRALANLYAICRKHFPESHRIEVIDVLKEPLRALAEAILVTPTVVKVSPAPELQIIGNLSEEEEVLRALGLPQKETYDRPTSQSSPTLRSHDSEKAASRSLCSLAQAEKALHEFHRRAGRCDRRSRRQGLSAAPGSGTFAANAKAACRRSSIAPPMSSR